MEPTENKPTTPEAAPAPAVNATPEAQAPAPELHTPAEWEQIFSVKIVEKTGWETDADWEKPITADDFKARAEKGKIKRTIPPHPVVEDMKKFNNDYGAKWLEPVLITTLNDTLFKIAEELRGIKNIVGRYVLHHIPLEKAPASEAKPQEPDPKVEPAAASEITDKEVDAAQTGKETV